MAEVLLVFVAAVALMVAVGGLAVAALCLLACVVASFFGRWGS